eukprot:2263321-Amphidinium_carterae.1
MRTSLHYVVLRETINTWLTILRMVAERAVHQAVHFHRRLHKIYQEAKQGLHYYYRINSALLVEPTYLDPTSVST